MPTYEEILSYKDHRFGWQLERVRIAVSADTLANSWKLFRLGKSSPGNPRKSSSRHKASRPNPRRAVIGTVQWYFSVEGSRFSFKGSLDRSSFEIYRQILAFCHENNINLKLFISPIHAVQLEVMDGLGLWHALEVWKRQLAQINEETATQFGQPPYPLWDFAGYNSFTSEPVLRRDNPQGRMNHFSDPLHYNRKVGNRILDTIFDRVYTPGFGVRLTSDSIEQDLARIRRERAIWRETNPDDFKVFRTLARETRPKSATIDTEF